MPASLAWVSRCRAMLGRDTRCQNLVGRALAEWWKYKRKEISLLMMEIGFVKMAYDWAVAATATLLRRARRSAGMSARRMPSGKNRCFEWPTRCDR